MERTIDECVENVLPVLLHQVVDVTKDTAGTCCQPLFPLLMHSCGLRGRDLPHGEVTRVLCESYEKAIVRNPISIGVGGKCMGGCRQADDGRGAKGGVVVELYILGSPLLLS